MDTQRSRSRRWARFVAGLRQSPEAIALGAAIGMFVGFTPPLGYHMVLCIVLATLLKANRSAAIIATWAVNPLTMVPVYVFSYHIGRLLLFLPSAGKDVQELMVLLSAAEGQGWQGCRDAAYAFCHLGGNVILSLVVGGTIVGAVAALATYLAVLGAGRSIRARRERRRAARRAAILPQS